MKRLVAYLATCLFQALLAASPVAASDYTVMIVTWRGCEQACTGFQNHLKYRDYSIEYLARDANYDTSSIPAFLDEARKRKVDLIVSWGTSVTRTIAGRLTTMDDPAYNQDIPQVFMIVADPVGAGIIESLEKTSRPNLTGTYNRMPEIVTLDTIRAFKPDFSHLGLLVNPSESNSVLKRDELQQMATAQGLTLTSVEIANEAGEPTANAIPAAMRELAEAGVDFVYLGSSSFLKDNGKIIATAAADLKLPVLSPYEEMVRNEEALISVAARYEDVGVLAAELAEKILIDGMTPGDIPVARMTRFAVTINMNVAKALAVFPPIDLLQIAEIVE